MNGPQLKLPLTAIAHFRTGVAANLDARIGARHIVEAVPVEAADLYDGRERLLSVPQTHKASH